MIIHTTYYILFCMRNKHWINLDVISFWLPKNHQSSNHSHHYHYTPSPISWIFLIIYRHQSFSSLLPLITIIRNSNHLSNPQWSPMLSASCIFQFVYSKFLSQFKAFWNQRLEKVVQMLSNQKDREPELKIKHQKASETKFVIPTQKKTTWKVNQVTGKGFQRSSFLYFWVTIVWPLHVYWTSIFLV